jgi:putative restriction endonuclease
MRYWWVNQNQTFDHETRGGYLWCPQRKNDNTRNHFYECMREVAPGDLIFSFCDTYIRAIGVARSYCYPCPRPDEFGHVGHQWDKVGWRVDVSFSFREKPIRPREHMDRLGPLLPPIYAPLRSNGDGLQAVYLTGLPPAFALELAALVGADVLALAEGLRAQDIQPELIAAAKPAEGIAWEDEEQRRIEISPIPETEKVTLILARRGQGLFRAGVRKIERACRITGVERFEHLRASHCLPWRASSNEQRLDPENGLLLTPSIDHLFDEGFISFEGDGRLLISVVAHKESLSKMGVPVEAPFNAGAFTSGQRRYLEMHRDSVFKKAAA